MSELTVVAVSGKQYIIKPGQILVVNKLDGEVGTEVTLDTLATFAEDGSVVTVGKPLLKTKVTAKIIEQGKGEKIRVAKFKAKVRYRNVRGFRPSLTKLEIVSIA